MRLQFEESAQSRMERNTVASVIYSPLIFDDILGWEGYQPNPVCLLKETFNKFGNALLWAPLDPPLTPHMCNDYWNPATMSAFRKTDPVL